MIIPRLCLVTSSSLFLSVFLSGCGASSETADAPAIASTHAAVTATSAPVVVASPLSGAILADTGQLLQVVASGAGLAYQWYRDGRAIAGATAATHAATAPGRYTVTVTNAAGAATSAAAVVTVAMGAAIPEIVGQPAAQAVDAGTAATFAVTATGASLAYQWYRDGEEIPGATGPVYTVATATAGHAGVYKAIVSNPAGAIASGSATLTVKLPATDSSMATVVSP